MNRRGLLAGGTAFITLAAGEPKELWFEPELGHTDFDFDRYLAR